MWTYEDLIPSLIANTIMQKGFNGDGVHKVYTITAADGYVLHDTVSDYPDIDPETGEEITVLGFVRGTVSCGASYDFTANPRQFYAVPESTVPENQIFGLTPETEVM